MELQNSMKKFGPLVPKSAAAEMFDGVEFPVASDFQSVLPCGGLEEVYLACEAMLATALAMPGETERRRLDGITAEFVL